MNIALDYDGTFTLDPDGWAEILSTMCYNDCWVTVVTSRNQEDPVEHEAYFNRVNIPIIYCDYEAKKSVCERLGIKIDIWIDNDPYYINHSFKEEDANEWRKW